MVRSTIHNPNLASMIPARKTDTDPNLAANISRVIASSSVSTVASVLFVALLPELQNIVKSMGEPGRKTDNTASELVVIRRNMSA